MFIPVIVSLLEAESLSRHGKLAVQEGESSMSERGKD